MKTIFVPLQVILIIMISPLVTGVIAKVKNNLRMKIGASIFQPYYNIFKLFCKEVIIPGNSSWIFRFAPYAALASSVAAASIIIPLAPAGFRSFSGDLFALLFIFALGRFFTALAGLDAGSSFGGMGASREMFIGALAEPAALLSLFAVSMSNGSTVPIPSSISIAHYSPVIAGFALFIVMLAETSRIPIDNRETHLELTMIHEAMVLEYSGRNLALIEIASHIKQLVFLTLIANTALPRIGFMSGAAPSIGFYVVKVLALAGVVAIIEVSTAKIRLFRAADLLAFGFVLSSIAVIVSAMGM